MVLSAKRTMDEFLSRVVDCGLAGSIFVVPLLMGGRHPMGQLALTIFAVAAAWAWSVRQCLRDDDNAWRSTAALPLFVLGTLLLLLQAAPLSCGLLSNIAPRAAEILPLWTAGDNPARLGSWTRVSFTPAETLAALVIFLDYALLFLTAVQRVRRIDDVERLLRWCALSAVIMAVIGIMQLLFGNGKFLWFYDHPLSLASGMAKGTFSNRNHFAQFLALGIGPLIWWLQDSIRRSNKIETSKKRLPAYGVNRGELKIYILGLAVGIVLFAGLLSLSRGGIAAMGLAALICAAVCYRTISFGGRLLAGLAMAGALIGGALGIFGYERVCHRLESLASGSLEKIDTSAGRRTIWAATVDATADFLPLGTGAGSFSQVYPMYTDLNSDARIVSTHAENSYLQEFLETGVVGAAMLLTGIGLCVFWCAGGIRSSTSVRCKVCAAAIAGSLAASSAHALVDFVWYVPGCMAMVAVLAACAQRTWQLSKGEDRRAMGDEAAVPAAAKHPFAPSLRPLLSPRLAWPAVAVGLAFVGGWMIVNRIGPAMAEYDWDKYLLARNVMRIRPASNQNPEIVEAELQRRWIACLGNVVRWSPTHFKAHLALAEAHRRLFDAMQAKSENRMPLAHIRDAAAQSRFPSRAALDEWLSRAVGPHYVHLQKCLDHTRQSLMICPLEGRAYVYLAELSFLCGGNDAVRRAYLQQALRVRPYDGAVLQAQAGEALLAGDVQGWMHYTRLAFRSGPNQRRQIIAELISVTPTGDLPAVAEYFMREFQPDLDGLRALHEECSKRSPAEMMRPLVRCRAQKAEEYAYKQNNVAVWLEACHLYSLLDDEDDTMRCARGALQTDPNSFDAHYAYALELMKRKAFAEAETNLKWCQLRRPNDRDVENKLREAYRGRLDGRRAAVENDKQR